MKTNESVTVLEKTPVRGVTISVKEVSFPEIEKLSPTLKGLVNTRWHCVYVTFSQDVTTKIKAAHPEVFKNGQLSELGCYMDLHGGCTYSDETEGKLTLGADYNHYGDRFGDVTPEGIYNRVKKALPMLVQEPLACATLTSYQKPNLSKPSYTKNLDAVDSLLTGCRIIGSVEELALATLKNHISAKEIPVLLQKGTAELNEVGNANLIKFLLRVGDILELPPKTWISGGSDKLLVSGMCAAFTLGDLNFKQISTKGKPYFSMEPPVVPFSKEAWERISIAYPELSIYSKDKEIIKTHFLPLSDEQQNLSYALMAMSADSEDMPYRDYIRWVTEKPKQAPEL